MTRCDGWMLTLETTNFQFQAFGTTEEQAIESMGVALEEHARQYRLEPDWWSDHDFHTTRFRFGETYRDGECLMRIPS